MGLPPARALGTAVCRPSEWLGGVLWAHEGAEGGGAGPANPRSEAALRPTPVQHPIGRWGGGGGSWCDVRQTMSAPFLRCC